MTVTKILNGGGGLSEELMDGASQLFSHAAIFSAYGMSSYQLPLHWTSLTVTVCKHNLLLVIPYPHELQNSVANDSSHLDSCP